MTEVIRKGNIGVVNSDVGCYSFELSGYQKLAQPGVLPFYTNIRQLMALQFGEFKVVPYGEQNKYPDEISQALDENNLTPEILNKQTQLLWGQGPALYQLKFEDGKRLKYWIDDPEVSAWLKSWDYEDYLLKTTIEFRTMNGHFTKYFLNKGARLNKSKAKIAYLEHVSSIKARLEWPDEATNLISNIITSESVYAFDTSYALMYLRKYPVFNPFQPFLNPVSMRYSNLHSFALDTEYSRSPIHGSLSWINLSSSIAKLLMSFNSNSAAIKYHIESPAAYWEAKEEALRQDCAAKNVEYKDKMMDELIDKTLSKFVSALSGQKNVGKFVHTQKIFDQLGNQYTGWTITPLDQKVKDFIDAQIAISKRASFETTAGLGVHPAISNISEDGNLPSGSEQLYAFKLYLMTGVDIPEMIVCKDINNAIAANFPNKNVKLGFYHDAVITEEATSPQNRIKNQ